MSRKKEVSVFKLIKAVNRRLGGAVTEMTIVKFGKMKDKISDFQEFVRERKKVEGKVDGDSIDFSETKTDELKMFVKKYLHKQNLDRDYRTIIRSGTLSVVEKKFYEAEG